LDAVPATEKVTLREEKIDQSNTDNNADPPEQETEGEKAKSTSWDPFTRLRLGGPQGPRRAAHVTRFPRMVDRAVLPDFITDIFSDLDETEEKQKGPS
jgi:hypothetical protein